MASSFFLTAESLAALFLYEKSWIEGLNREMEPHLITNLKAEETLFSLLEQIPNQLMYLADILQILRYFVMKILNFPGLLVDSNIRCCGQNGHFKN